MNTLLTLLALLQGAPGQRVDARLIAHQPLLDTLLLVVDSVGPGEVYVRPIRGGARGEHVHLSHIVLADARDQYALLHEYGHHYAMVVLPDYLAFAEMMRLDPYERPCSEAFADAFAVAMLALRGEGVLLPGRAPRRRPGEEFMIRRLRRRRPFRRRDRDTLGLEVPYE
jgi:hypothetical protein